MTDLHATIQQAAHSGAFGAHQQGRPSEAQCRAGNYRKGRVTVQGLRIAIEVPHNQERRGVDPNGTAWACRMAAHYGYFEGTRGRDGDEVDVFLGPVPESPRVYVVNQNDAAGAFDEHKVMLGFQDADAARAAYLGSYSPGWTGLGSLVGATVAQLRWWLKHGDTARPFSANALPYDGEADMTPTTWDANAMPVETDLAALLYSMRRGEDAPLLLDALAQPDVLEDVDAIELFDALVVVNQRLEAKMQQIQRVMATVSDEVKPTALQITPPFRQRGTTNICAIYELSDGQTVSVWFHNPDSTPNKILPTDELVSWKWMLNKLDITIVVAPERGRDLNPREVSRRIMRLAEKNSAKFQKANASRAERLAKVEQLRSEVSGKEAQLQGLEAEIEALTAQLEAKRAEPEPVVDPEPTPEPEPEVPVESFVDKVRRLIPEEFETRDLGADDIATMAADGLGIRVVLKSFASGSQSATAYVLDDKGQDSMGSAQPEEVGGLIDKALNTIAAMRAPQITEPADRNPFEHAGYRIYPITVRDQQRWAVQSHDNRERLQRGEREVGGDSIVSGREEAIAEAERQAAAAKADALRMQEADEAVAREAAEKAEADDTDGFAEQFPQVQAARIRATLAKKLNTREGVMSLRNFIRLLVKQGRKMGEFNGERILIDPETENFFGTREIGKTGLDYAEYLIGRQEPAEPELAEGQQLQATPEPEPSPAGIAARALLQAVIDGTEDLFAADLANRLEAVHREFQGNAEVMELFEQAANAYSAAVVARAKEVMAGAA